MSNAKVWIALLILLLLFFIVKTPVFAGDVVINEFLVDPDVHQWVELYNKGSGTINIGGWFIDDNGGTQKFTIPNGIEINTLEFKVFESSSFNLNRTSGDTINLLNGITLEDSYSYDTGPGVNNSYGRDADGIGSWVVFSAPTKGSTNNMSTPLPTATPTLTPSPTSTNTPTPTKAPTPTKVPTPTKTPTSTPTVKPTSTPKVPTPTKIPTSSETSIKSVPIPIKSGLSVTSFPTSVLGESTESAKNNISITDKPKVKISPPEKETKVLASNTSNLSKILIGIGVIFLVSCGILAFRGYMKSRKEREING